MSSSKVLVADGTQYVPDRYTAWLVDYTVQTVDTGPAALDALSEPFDLVVLDHRLPGVSTRELLAAAASHDDCRVLLLTTVQPNIDIASLGFDGYLCKPLSEAELRGTVRQVLARRSSVDSPEVAGAARSTRATGNGTAVPGAAGVTRADGDASSRGRAVPSDGIDMEQVAAHSLPPVVSELADDYERRIGSRDRFLLKWLHSVFPSFRLSSVDDASAERCRADKTIASLYVTLIDDLGERHHDEATLAAAAKLPFPDASIDRDAAEVDHDYLAMTESVWNTLAPRLREAPRYDEIESLLRYDLRQVIHAVRYSMLVGDHPEMGNMAEAQALGAHNMMLLAYADIDLAYSPGFDLDELGALRSLLVELQQMARIGNWVTTWERELREGDLSAGIFISAVEGGIVSLEELRTAGDDPAVQDRIRSALDGAHVEEAFVEQWQQRRDRLRADQPTIGSLDVDGLIDGMERVMAYHLASRGLK